jgi:hypothetical protein
MAPNAMKYFEENGVHTKHGTEAHHRISKAEEKHSRTTADLSKQQELVLKTFRLLIAANNSMADIQAAQSAWRLSVLRCGSM